MRRISKIVWCAFLTAASVAGMGSMVQAQSDRSRVATVNSVRGNWVLIAADGAPAEPLTLSFGVTDPIQTIDGCNSFRWTSVTISPTGELGLPIGPIRTLAGCQNREPNPVVVKALSAPATLRRVDSDLLLDGVSKLRFRLVVPTFPSLATDQSLAGGWSGSSLNGEPLNRLHVLQFGIQGNVESSAGPCAGLYFERFAVDSRGLLQPASESTAVPGCAEDPSAKLIKLLASRPRMEIDRQSLLVVRSPSAVAIFSKRIPPGPAAVPTPLVEQLVPPERPAVPASDASAVGRWAVESINGIAAPAGLWLRLPAVQGFDGCNSFSATTPKRSPKASARKPTFMADGSANIGPLVSTYKKCSEVGFTWDARLRNVFRELPIAEHVGDTLVLRSSSTEFASGTWITLRRASV
jgi:META domain